MSSALLNANTISAILTFEILMFEVFDPLFLISKSLSVSAFSRFSLMYVFNALPGEIPFDLDLGYSFARKY